MRYKIRCPHCAHAFIVEAPSLGRLRFRCPNCGKTLSCRIDVNTPQYGGPAGFVSASLSQQQKQDERRRRERKPLSRNANLALFFTVSILFIVLVVVGFYVAYYLYSLLPAGLE